MGTTDDAGSPPTNVWKRGWPPRRYDRSYLTATWGPHDHCKGSYYKYRVVEYQNMSLVENIGGCANIPGKPDFWSPIALVEGNGLTPEAPAVTLDKTEEGTVIALVEGNGLTPEAPAVTLDKTEEGTVNLSDELERELVQMLEKRAKRAKLIERALDVVISTVGATAATKALEYIAKRRNSDA